MGSYHPASRGGGRPGTKKMFSSKRADTVSQNVAQGPPALNSSECPEMQTPGPSPGLLHEGLWGEI